MFDCRYHEAHVLDMEHCETHPPSPQQCSTTVCQISLSNHQGYRLLCLCLCCKTILSVRLDRLTLRPQRLDAQSHTGLMVGSLAIGQHIHQDTGDGGAAMCGLSPLNLTLPPSPSASAGVSQSQIHVPSRMDPQK